MVHTMATVTLKAGHVRPVFFGHPWVFQQAIERVEGGALPGDEVTVVDPRRNLLGTGLYSPKSAIAVRMFTREQRHLDGALLTERIARARQRRIEIGLPGAAHGHLTSGYRLVHGEGDDLPGLIIDVYDDVVAVQLHSVGMKRREGLVFESLHEVLNPRAIVDRTSAATAKLEGFEPASGVVRGEPVEALVFSERGFTYEIPITLGQKTGFYFDQRDCRARVEDLAKGKRVLDAYSFVGAFAMAAARGGATEVVAVDESAGAVTQGATIARANGFGSEIQFVRQDALKALGEASNKTGFDMVICDPPKLAPSRASRDVSLSAYRNVARAACRATRPGGVLVFSSCSSAVRMEDLVRVIALGAADARTRVTIFERRVQAADHPVPAAFPEGLYLKTLFCHVDPLTR